MAFDPVSAALDIGGKLIDRLWPDPATRDKAKLDLLQMQQTGQLAQLTADTEISKAILAVGAAEASSGKLWVSGWRPFIGWAGGSALAYQAIVQPFFVFIAHVCGSAVVAPSVDATVLGALVTTMVTGQVARSYDKRNGKVGD